MSLCFWRLCCLFCLFFFFKQKTAYEMRISDWSSDVCSSDLASVLGLVLVVIFMTVMYGLLGAMASAALVVNLVLLLAALSLLQATLTQIGRASCRERVCQYV